jgi:hypothetical protein
MQDFLSLTVFHFVFLFNTFPFPAGVKCGKLAKCFDTIKYFVDNGGEYNKSFGFIHSNGCCMLLYKKTVPLICYLAQTVA